MTRKEALEYVNNMWMYEDTKNALETLIPEFGKTCSDKVIDREDKYKKALLEARAVLEPCLKYSKGKVREALDSIDKELKRFESEDEDERIRKCIGMALTDVEEQRFMDYGTSLKDCLAWLEKQKEKPKTADSIPSDCTSDVKCEDRWHKVSDSLPDNPREVLCKDEAGNFFIGRYYTGEGWEISNYDDEDKPHHLNPPVSKWIDFPSEKQKEPENTSASTMAPSCWEVEQKEQKPVEPSDDELQRYQDELYDFKVFATKQAKEHHISFVHDFEWNNFCAGLLSYFNEQKPAECIEDSVKFEEGFKAGRESGLRDEQKYVLNNLDSYGLCKPAELSEEEFSKTISLVYKAIRKALASLAVYAEDEALLDSKEETLSYYSQCCAEQIFKSLRPQPHWKPSEEQMNALNKARRFIPYNCDILESLYNQLKKL